MIDYRELHWWSDWDGEEVGYDNVPVVGLYAVKSVPQINMYIDTETGRVLEIWIEQDDEE